METDNTYRVNATCNKGHHVYLAAGEDSFGRLVFIGPPGGCSTCKEVPGKQDGALTRKERRAFKRLQKGL